MKTRNLLLDAIAACVVVSCCKAPATTGRTVLDAIATRTSIRAYQPTPVGADTVEMVLRAAMAAPTARNRQPWAFVVVDENEALARLADSLPYAKMLREAPLAIVVCGVLPEEGDNPWWVQDCSAATENLLLAAHAMGLGAVWTGGYPHAERVEAIRAALGLPERVVPLNVIPMGYPAERPAPKQKWDSAKVHHNRW